MRKHIIRTIAVISIIVGIAVMLGWIFDIPFLKSIVMFSVTMKFATALSFTFTGTMLLLDSLNKRRKVVIALACVQLAIMGLFFVGGLTGKSIGIEKVFFSAADAEFFTGVPGYPSLATSLLFILASYCVIRRTPRCNCIVGVLMVVTGSVAIAGYLFDVPALYYWFKDLKSLSTAMARHTAVMFIFLGIGFVLSRKKVQEVTQ